MQVDLKVVQLLCSRLCHDLVGPSGAVHNGVELLEESGPNDGGEALALVSSSVDTLTARLAFFRLAFGLGGLSGRKPAIVEAHDLAAGFFGGGRVTLDWPMETSSGVAGNLPVPAAKLLMNMILVAADTLPRGGTLKVSIASLSETGENSGTGLAIKASGIGATMKDELLAALIPATEDGISHVLSAHNVHGYFCRKLAQSLGGEIEMLSGEDEVQFAVFVPDATEG